MDQWTQTSIKSGFITDSESAKSSVVNADAQKHVKHSKSRERGKENRGFFPSKTHLGFRTSSSSKRDITDNSNERESWISRAKTVYNTRNSAKTKKHPQNGTKGQAWAMSSGSRKHFSANKIVTVDSNGSAYPNNDNNDNNKRNVYGNNNGEKTGAQSTINSHFSSSTKRFSKASDPKKALEISLSLGVNGAHDSHHEHLIYHDDDDDFHHHHNHHLHHRNDDNVNYNYNENDHGAEPPPSSPPRFFSPRYDAGTRRTHAYGRTSSSAHCRKLGQLPTSAQPTTPFSAPPRHCDACAVDYVRKWLKTNRDTDLVAPENDSAQTTNKPDPLAFHEPFQLMHGEGREEPNHIYMLMNAAGGKMSYDVRYNREPVSLRTVSLPRRGRIKLTALPYELDNPEYFDDRKTATEKRDLVSQYREQLMGPALPNPSPDGSLIRNRSILKQVKSDVKRLEKERGQEAEIRQAMEGNRIASLVEDLLKYEMSEVPNINSNLQRFVTKVQTKPLDINSSPTSFSRASNEDGNNNAPREPTNRLDKSDTEDSKSSTPTSSMSSVNNHKTGGHFDRNHSNSSFQNQRYNQPTTIKSRINNVSGKNNKTINNDDEDDENDETIQTSPRSLPDINASTTLTNSNTHNKNVNKNNDTKTITITTPRKAFEEVIRKMEASNSYVPDSNTDTIQHPAIPHISQTPSSSPYASPRSTLWYNHSQTNKNNHHHNHPNNVSTTATSAAKITPGYESTKSTKNNALTDELSLHCIIKNAQKITSHQLNNQHKPSYNSRQSTSTVLDLRRK